MGKHTARGAARRYGGGCCGNDVAVDECDRDSGAVGRGGAGAGCRWAGGVSPATAGESRRASAGGPAGRRGRAVVGDRVGVGRPPVCRVLRDVQRGPRGGEGSGRGGGPAVTACSSGGRRRAEGAGRPVASAAGAAGQAQPILVCRRTVAGDGDVPFALGLRVLGDRAGRIGAGGGAVAAAAGPDARTAGHGPLRSRVRIRRWRAAGCVPARRGGVVPALQPARRVLRAVVSGAGASGGRYGRRRPALQPRLLLELGVAGRPGHHHRGDPDGRRGRGVLRALGEPVHGSRPRPPPDPAEPRHGRQAARTLPPGHGVHRRTEVVRGGGVAGVRSPEGVPQ